MKIQCPCHANKQNGKHLICCGFPELGSSCKVEDKDWRINLLRLSHFALCVLLCAFYLYCTSFCLSLPPFYFQLWGGYPLEGTPNQTTFQNLLSLCLILPYMYLPWEFPDNSDNSRHCRACYTPKLNLHLKTSWWAQSQVWQWIYSQSWLCQWLSNFSFHHEDYHFPSCVRMSCRCDDAFTTSCSPSSPSHNVAQDEVDDFTAFRAELCYPHCSYWIEMSSLMSFKYICIYCICIFRRKLLVRAHADEWTTQNEKRNSVQFSCVQAVNLPAHIHTGFNTSQKVHIGLGHMMVYKKHTVDGVIPSSKKLHGCVSSDYFYQRNGSQR